MDNDKYYSIGRASKLCGVSVRILRYYEEKGIVIPDIIDKDSGYRYYSRKKLGILQSIRYLVDAGLSLDEIKYCRETGYRALLEKLVKNTSDAQDMINYHQKRLDGLKDWVTILVEGDRILAHPGAFTVSVKYLPEQRYFYYHRDHPVGEEEAELRTEIEYWTLSKQDGHDMVDVGGAFFFIYDSYEEHINGTNSGEAIGQLLYRHCHNYSNTRLIGGYSVISAYHIGDRARIGETYRKMEAWAEDHNFKLKGSSMERRVLDIYSVAETDELVTNILLPIEEDEQDKENFRMMHQYNEDLWAFPQDH